MKRMCYRFLVCLLLIAPLVGYVLTRATKATYIYTGTTIGDSKPFNRSRLTSVIISASITNISNRAFYRCIDLTKIVVEPSNPAFSSIDGVLFDKTQTSLIQYPGGKAGSYTIPASVTTIGDYAFSGCSGLPNVTIPASITTIGDSAFFGCSGLTNVIIPASVTTIGDSAFSYCSGLINITVESANPTYSSIDGVLFNKTQAMLIQYPKGKTGDYTIPDGVTAIGDGAFAGAHHDLTCVTIPDSVTSIGIAAFASCSGLTCVTIPDSITSISDGMFDGCSSLTSVTIPASVTSIGLGAFGFCKDLTSVTIPDSINSISDGMFYSCTGLTNMAIPASVTTIGRLAFFKCSNLQHVYFAGNPPVMGPLVFDRTRATLYYLPAYAEFWPATLADCPTKLWEPAIPTTDLNSSH